MANAHNTATEIVNTAIRNLKHAIMAEIECAQIAKVVKYDKKISNH